jgi:hypothetical protein
MSKRLTTVSASIFLILGSIFLMPAHGAVVTATGTVPGVCDQTVSDSTNVDSVRLSGGDCVITFKSGSIDWTAPQGISNTQVLLVGGGGGGGGTFDTRGGGGGGAGQVSVTSNYSFTGGSVYSISVGAKGAGGLQPARANAAQNVGSNGGDSNISIGGTNIFIAYGGLGGCASRTTTFEVYCSATSDNGTGGAAATLVSGGGRGGASGGGGGGSAGNGGAAVGGAGGTGTSVSITGTAITYGVGGNGGTSSTNAVGTSASANTGNGGRGSSSNGATNYNGGDGGSGVVIVRYIISPFISAPTYSGLIFKGTLESVTVSANMRGTVRFFFDGKRIPGCMSIATTGNPPTLSATCTWKPSVSGSHSVVAILTPGDNGFSVTSSKLISLPVARRTGNR